MALGDRAHARMLIGNVRCCCRRSRRSSCSPAPERGRGRRPCSGAPSPRGRRSGSSVSRLGDRRSAARHAAAWFKWHIVAAAVRLGAAAHRAGRLAASRAAAETAVTAAIDVDGPRVSHRFSLLVADHRAGHGAGAGAVALRSLARSGRSCGWRPSSGCCWRRGRRGQERVGDGLPAPGLGMSLAFAVLVGVVARRRSAAITSTGSPADIGWMLPFWFAAWAAATAPASPPATRATIGVWPTRHASPVLLFAALLAVPIVGYGLRTWCRSAAASTACASWRRPSRWSAASAIWSGCASSSGAVEQADQRVRLLATACEQAGELIIIVRKNRIEYANDAFCVASGYSREELESLPPIALVPPGSEQTLAALRDNLTRAKVTRATAAIARKDGSTFQAACVGGADCRRRRPGHPFRRRDSGHHRRAAAARTAGARRASVGHRRVRRRRGARAQQPAAVGDRNAGADADAKQDPACASIWSARASRPTRRPHRPQSADVHPPDPERAPARSI